MQRVLYQFPISHYCEKARWVLDRKRIPYRIYNQLPGLHARPNLRRTGCTSVPVLVENGRAIGGSHAIALHAEAIGRGPPLVPKSGAERSQFDSLVTYFDDIVGPAVRRLAYRELTTRPAQFRFAVYREYAFLPRVVGTVMAPLARRVIASMYDVHGPTANDLPDVIRAGADRVEAELRRGTRYVIGDELSLADITVASLLAPIVGPPRSPWSHDTDIPELRALRQEIRQRQASEYVMRIYATRHVAPQD